jgi:hypothetical protein
MAWLNTAPDKAEGDKSKAPNITRLQAIKNAFNDGGYGDYEPDVPPIECASHLLTYLWQRGPTLVGTMGQAALTDVDLVAFQENTGIELSEWEATTLIRLSREYLGESGAASKPDRDPPFESVDAERLRRHRIKQKLRAFLYD